MKVGKAVVPSCGDYCSLFACGQGLKQGHLRSEGGKTSNESCSCTEQLPSVGLVLRVYMCECTYTGWPVLKELTQWLLAEVYSSQSCV